MKNRITFTSTILTLLLLFMISSVSNAQYIKPAYGKKDLSPHGELKTSWYNIYWFYELNAGARLMGSTSSQSTLGPGLNSNASLGYLFSEKFGLKGRADYHGFTFTPGLSEPTSKGTAISLSLEATANILAFTSAKKFSKFRLNLHGGLGWTTYSNPSFKEYRKENNISMEDPAIHGNDDMGHIIIGLTPQYHINGRVSINLDLSTFLLVKQDFTFDNYNGIQHEGLGNISSISLGLTFRP